MSTRSIRFVAAITVTLWSSSRPSISVRICEITRSVTWESPLPPRTGVIASISSKKMMQGAAVFALRNVSRTVRSDSPTHLLRNSGPRTEMKFASASVATAFARRVLPVPGGPYSMMPRGGRASKWANSLFIFNGHSIDSRISCFASSRPPMSSQWTFGLSMRTSRSVEGSISRYAWRKSSRVTSSRLSTSGGT